MQVKMEEVSASSGQFGLLLSSPDSDQNTKALAPEDLRHKMLHRLRSVHAPDHIPDEKRRSRHLHVLKKFFLKYGNILVPGAILAVLAVLFRFVPQLEKIDLWQWFSTLSLFAGTLLVCNIVEDLVLVVADFTSNSRFFWGVWFYCSSLKGYLAQLLTFIVALVYWKHLNPPKVSERVVRTIDDILASIVGCLALFVLRQLIIRHISWTIEAKNFVEQAQRARDNEKIINRMCRRISLSGPSLSDTIELSISDRISSAFFENLKKVQADPNLPMGRTLSDGDELGSEVDGEMKLHMADLKTKKDAIKFANDLFRHMDVHGKNMLDLEDFQRVFPNASNAVKAFLKFAQGSSLNPVEMEDLEDPAVIDCSTFEKSILRMREQRLSLASELQSVSCVSTVLITVVKIICWVLVPLVIATGFRVSLTSLALTASSILISFSFAFGTVISRTVESCYFLLITKPYKVGDRIKIGDSTTPTVLVQKIDLMATTVLTQSNQMVIMPNHVIAAQNVVNLNRTEFSTQSIDMVLDLATPAEVLQEFENDIKSYLATNKSEWKPGSLALYTEVSQASTLQLSIWVDSRMKWQDGSALWAARSKLINAIRDSILRLGIRYHTPPQFLEVSM